VVEEIDLGVVLRGKRFAYVSNKTKNLNAVKK
jgi:hypothetical protein